MLHDVEEANGGLMAPLPCDIPPNMRQVRYARQKENSSSLSSPDPILEVMSMAAEDGSFIRKIDVTNTPIIVLFNDEKLQNVKRFCAPEQEEKQASVLSCDMTFKLGDFWVVLTQFHNLQVIFLNFD